MPARPLITFTAADGKGRSAANLLVSTLGAALEMIGVKWWTSLDSFPAITVMVDAPESGLPVIPGLSELTSRLTT